VPSVEGMHQPWCVLSLRMLDIAALTRCFELIPILAVKSHSVATGEHSSTRKGMQGAASKPGVANTRKAETKENIERDGW
jgi:hypothetical protein